MRSVRSARDIDAALRKKGFVCKSDGDHLRYTLVLPDGIKTRTRTKISHGMGNSTLSDELISLMSHQLHLTKSQFLDLIDCSLDEAGYREILKGRGLVV